MDVGVSYSPNYFSMDDIIATEIRVPCKTDVPLPKFGFLDPSLNREALPTGSQLEMPLWVAQAMAKQSRRYVSVSLPVKYKEAYRDVLKADSTVVDLNKMGPDFYQSGLYLASLPHNESEQLAEVLPNVLKLRLQKMSDTYAYTTAFHSADEATQKQKGHIMKDTILDGLEQTIYKDARKGALAMKDWLEREH